MMTLIFRRRVRLGRRGAVNLSRRGASLSWRFGPLTVNSGGRWSLRLGRGVSWRGK
jgi:hypothetical protein